MSDLSYQNKKALPVHGADPSQAKLHLRLSLFADEEMKLGRLAPASHLRQQWTQHPGKAIKGCDKFPVEAQLLCQFLQSGVG